MLNKSLYFKRMNRSKILSEYYGVLEKMLHTREFEKKIILGIHYAEQRFHQLFRSHRKRFCGIESTVFDYIK